MSEEAMIVIQLVAVILWTVALCVFILCVNCFHTVRKGNTKIQKGTISKFIDDYWDKGLDTDLIRVEISWLVLSISGIVYILSNLKNIDQNTQLPYNDFENQKMDWSVFMGWAEVITLTVGILGVIGAIVGVILSDRKLFRKMEDKIGSLNNTTLSGEHDKIINVLSGKMGSLDNTTLSGEHEQIKKEIILFLAEKEKNIQNKIGVLDNTTLSGQNNNIKKAVDELMKKMENKEQIEILNRQSLTNDMNNIARSVDVLASFKEVMIEQQSELCRVKSENLKLTQENQELKQQLQEYEQAAQLTPHEQDFSQPDMKFE